MVAPESVDFGTTEVTKVDVYQEAAKIEKQAVIREEVSVRKEVETDTVKATETLRKEELEINTDDRSIIQEK